MTRTMMKRVLALTLACGVVASSAQAAPILFYGADNAAGVGGAHPVSATAAAAFDAAVTETLITFEGLPVGNFAALAVAAGVTATLTGQDPTFCSGICGTNDAALGFNTTAAGTNHVRVNPPFDSLTGATLTFSFVNPINAFGAYFTGTQVGFPGTIHATFNDGTARDFVIGKDSDDPGGILFWGFTDIGASLTSISFNTGATTSIRDLWGVDDVRFAPAAAAVPEPTSMLLLGTGILGMARSYRKRKAQR